MSEFIFFALFVNLKLKNIIWKMLKLILIKKLFIVQNEIISSSLIILIL